MLRTCTWGGLHSQQWQQSVLGGSDVLRQPRRYAADAARAVGQADICTKYQKSTMCLLPGLMLYWCLTCRKCIFFHVMGNAESPRSVSLLLLSCVHASLSLSCLT